MNWEDERYVRLYVRDTITWKLIGWQGRCLLPLLLRKVDRSGCIELQGAGDEGIAALVDIPIELVTAGLAKLIERSVVEVRGDVLVFPKYVAAHEARQSDRLRAQESRARRREQVMEREPVTNCDSGVTNRDRTSRDVTRCHTASPVEEKRREEKSGDQDLAGGSSPAPRSDSAFASPKTPAPVQGSRPAQQVALLPDEPKRDAPARQTRASKPEAPTTATWEAYAGAYTERYGHPPARNAKVNGQLAQLVAQLGADEAPQVAAFYLTHPAAIYNFHPIGLLLRDCQALRTQWQRGSVVTPTAARRDEETAANPALALLLAQRRKKNGDG